MDCLLDQDMIPHALRARTRRLRMLSLCVVWYGVVTLNEETNQLYYTCRVIT